MATNRTSVNAVQQLRTKLELGAKESERGELLDGDQVFEELRDLIDERRRLLR